MQPFVFSLPEDYAGHFSILVSGINCAIDIHTVKVVWLGANKH